MLETVSDRPRIGNDVADCNGCVLLRTQGKIEKQYCMSLQTAMIVFVKCRRSDCNACVC